jgi:mannose-1-phosphate guanylyltransferase
VQKVFAGLDPISVDYGIMERTDRAAVVPADIGWSDVGSWTALEEVSERDASGNIISGNIVDIGSRDSVLYARSGSLPRSVSMRRLSWIRLTPRWCA